MTALPSDDYPLNFLQDRQLEADRPQERFEREEAYVRRDQKKIVRPSSIALRLDRDPGPDVLRPALLSRSRPVVAAEVVLATPLGEALGPLGQKLEVVPRRLAHRHENLRYE